MADELKDLRVAFLVANEGVEQIELTSPWETVEGAGGTPILIAPKAGKVQAFDHLDKAGTFTAELSTKDASIDDIDAIVLPGGVANPDQLRMDQAAVALLQAAVDSGVPVAVICHGPWTLVEADRVRNRAITSYPSLKTDIRNAGGNWVDEEVCVCTGGTNTIVSSRRPDDLPAFNRTLVDVFGKVPAAAR